MDLLLFTWIILGMGSANERRRYRVTPPFIGWTHTRNDTETKNITWELQNAEVPTLWGGNTDYHPMKYRFCLKKTEQNFVVPDFGFKLQNTIHKPHCVEQHIL